MLERAMTFIAALDDALSTLVEAEQRAFNVTATKGVAIYPRDGLDSAGLLRRADAALHSAA